MPDPLGGARFKLRWAYRHIDALDRAVNAYVHSKPYDLIVEREARGAVDWVTVHMPKQVNRELPEEIAGYIGDCLTNLRAALDYVAQELANKHSGKLKGPYFPLTATITEFQKESQNLMTQHRFPNDVVSTLESVQPYHSGFEHLGVLKKLVNQDKHQLPVIATTFLGPGIRLSSGIGASGATSVSYPAASSDPVDAMIETAVYLKDFPKWTILELTHGIADSVGRVLPLFDSLVI